MRVKVSIIVPVYNSEPFLTACIDSLLAQTLSACEFIFINDGSSDGSGTLLDRLQHSDPRIKVIHQSNQGVSMARNAGLAVAKGEYIGFVDSDDTAAPDLFEKLYQAATAHHCDVVVSNFISEMGEHRVETRYPFPAGIALEREYVAAAVLPYFLKSDDLNTVCTKLYRTEIIEADAIRFPKRVALGEDGVFNMEVFCRARSMVYLDYAGYLYKERAGSATRSIGDKDYFRRAIEVFESEPPEAYKQLMNEADMRSLKAIRLVHTMLSLIHIYFAPSKDMGILRRYRYVRNAVRHAAVRDSLPSYCKAEYASLGGYQRLMVKLLRRRSVSGLYALAWYSRMRNQ